VKEEAGRLGIRSKQRSSDNPRRRGAVVLSRGAIHQILTNPLYSGRIRHKTESYPGKHPAIIEPAVWEEVQDLLRQRAARARRTTKDPIDHTAKEPSPLVGKLRDETGDRLTPSHARSGERRKRYYVSRRLVMAARDVSDPSGWRLPAEELERCISDAVETHIRASLEHNRLLEAPTAQALHRALQAGADLKDRLRGPGQAWAKLIATACVTPGLLEVALDANELAALLDLSAEDIAGSALCIEVPFRLRRRGVEARLVTGAERRRVDPVLCRSLARSHGWMEQLRAGKPIAAIARSENVSERFIRARLTLALLAPDIVAAILDGRQPVTLTTELVIRTSLPADWSEQRRILGF
jgi:hypothetical protein